MAEPLNITITKPPSLLPDDKVWFMVDGVNDVVIDNLHGTTRKSQGFGHGIFGYTPFGSSILGPEFGNGPFGLGPHGRGVSTTTITTESEYVAGDYLITAKGVDVLGNAGELSNSVTIQHRPTPPPPFNLATTSGTDNLVWQWQDPAPDTE